MGERIYHEKQVMELCALHALNNLFQKPVYTKAQLDDICRRLSPDRLINPHKSMLGLGNYDVNVLMAALQLKNCEAVWFDKRRDPRCLKLDNVVGFILNIPSEYKIGFIQLPLRRKHWIALQRINGTFYNLDSKLDQPECIGTATELLEFLREQLCSKDRELFLIVRENMDKDLLWEKARLSQEEGHA